MKKILLTITVLFVTLLTMAQSPNLMNFQGVARNAVGNVIPNQLIGVRLSILSGGAAGTLVYQESRNVFTNAFGLFTVVLGSPGTLTQFGTIAGVNWSGLPSGAASKFLQVELDPAGGTNYVSVGSTQMVSVPYALNAGGAGPIGPAGGDLTGTYPNPQILIPLIKTQAVTTSAMVSMTNTATTGTGGGFFGSSASTDPNANAIQGTITSATPGAGSAGVRGTNNSTGANGAGVVGTQSGSGIGVLGQGTSGTGVRGESLGAGVGVYGTSPSGAGVYGTSNASNGGFFENTNAANSTSTLVATTNGSGNAVNGINSGTGRGALFQVTNAASTASAVEGQTNGTGASWGGRFSSSGTNGAGLFIQSNAANTANNVQSNQAGLGTAGFFQTTNTANTADVILASTNTTSTTPAAVHGTAGTSGTSVVIKKGVWGDSDNGWGVYGTSSTAVGVGGTTTTGTGVSAFAFTTGTALSATSLSGVSGSITTPAGNASNTLNVSTAGTGAGASVDNTNAANVSNVIQATNANGNSGLTSATTGGGAVVFARKGAGLTTGLTNPSSVYASAADPTAGTAVASVGIVNNGIGVAGFSINNGTAVLGQAIAAGGTGVAAVNTSTGYGLVTVGRVQIQGQGAGAGKVLGSDAVGNATWQTLAGLGGVSGSGTLNWVPKWTPNGTTLGNSQIFDDGTNVGVGTGSPNGKLDVANSSNTVRGMQVINSSTTNPSSTIFAQNNSVGGADPVESAAVTGLFSPIAVATPIITGPSAIKGIASPNATVGALGGIGVQGASGNGYGVAGISQNGTGVFATGLGGTSYALQTSGRVQIQGQGAGAGKVLSSDATGNASWNTLTSLGAVAGSGTLNFMTKWTPDGFTIGNALMYDDGTNVGLGTITPTARFTVSHGGSTGIDVTSTAGFSVVDIDAANGDAALRFGNAGTNQWNMRNRPADNYLEWFELGGGGSRMVIQDGTGNVGIGETANPTYKLDVLHGGATGIRSRSSGTFSVIDIDAANGDAALRFQAAGVGQWNTRNRPADNYYEIFELGGGGSRVVIQDGSGNVGIGETTNPTYKLDVLHGGATGIRSRSSSTFSLMDIDAANGDAALRFARAGVNQWNIRNRPADDYLEIFELGGGGSRMVIQDGSGNVGIGQTTNPTYKLDVLHGGATGLRVQSSATFSIIDIDGANGDAALRFANAGVNQWNTRNRPADNYYEIFELGGGGSRMVIQDGTGNVGIGQTTNPTYKLDVLHGGATGLRVQSSSTFSVIDIDGQNGDAALRFVRAGVNQWNIRNNPANDDLQFFELGGGGERMRIENTTGNVVVNGNLSKGGGSFKIDDPIDPENKYLYHSFVESPDMMNIYNGNVVTDASGKAVVKLPAYFEALNMEFRYQLTVIGSFAQAIVNKEVSANQFEIATNQPNTKVSWQVTGIRHDAYANQNRIPNEVDKAAKDKGKYLHPKAFGQPMTKAIDYYDGSTNGSSVNDIKSSNPATSAAKTQSLVGTSVEDKAPTPAIVATKAAEAGTSLEQKAPVKVEAKTASLVGTSVEDKAPAKAATKVVDKSGSVADEKAKTKE